MTINKHSKTLKGSLNLTPGIAWGWRHRLEQHAPPVAGGIAWGWRHRPWQQAPPGESGTIRVHTLKEMSNIQ